MKIIYTRDESISLDKLSKNLPKFENLSHNESFEMQNLQKKSNQKLSTLRTLSKAKKQSENNFNKLEIFKSHSEA